MLSRGIIHLSLAAIMSAQLVDHYTVGEKASVPAVAAVIMMLVNIGVGISVIMLGKSLDEDEDGE